MQLPIIVAQGCQTNSFLCPPSASLILRRTVEIYGSVEHCSRYPFELLGRIMLGSLWRPSQAHLVSTHDVKPIGGQEFGIDEPLLRF